ncbi:MAG: hypothetical protein HY303_07705 [Candidatus Wallbacteria bacterium]|nr:hypothetical protein [Candidatus Wallbacteria bacterium]
MNRQRILQNGALSFLAAGALLAAAVPLFGANGATGSIEGTVSIKAAVPRDEMKPASATSPDAYGDGAGGSSGREEGPAMNESEPENVVVYVSGTVQGGPFKPPAVHPQLVQFKKRLSPHVLPILVGTIVDFPNKDDFNHNIFSLSSVKKFDLGLYKSGQSKSETFDKPGQVKVYCNIHSQMRAIVQVLENPFFTKPAASGKFKIDAVPAGDYELVAWHEKFPAVIKKVTVKAGDSLKVDFSFE